MIIGAKWSQWTYICVGDKYMSIWYVSGSICIIAKKNIATTKKDHNEQMAGQKRKYESIIAKKDELINEQSEKIKQLEDECKQLREELEKSHNEGGNKNSKKKQKLL